MNKMFYLFIFSLSLPFFLMAEHQHSPEFQKGYVYSKLEDRFPNAQIKADVINGEIIIYQWPAYLAWQEINAYLQLAFPGCYVQFNSDHIVQNQFIVLDRNETLEIASQNEGTFLPELNRFFPTMLAQPHIIGYSVGFRSYDKIFKSTIPVSIGDQFSLYQFKLNSSAKLYFGVEACVWAVFEGKTKSLSLINADYFVSLPLTYVNDRFSARLRVFHESSHLGDEFLLENKIDRKNPSMEGIDLSLCYEPIDRLELFLGYRRILRSDESFKVKPNSVYYGFNYFLECAKVKMFSCEGIPYIAAYFANHENNHWNFDKSIAIGFQWEKYYGHKLRIYLEAHDGHSAEGQFARKKAKAVSINLLYGY